MSVAEYMKIQMFFHPLKPHIGYCPSCETSCNKSCTIPDLRKMCGNHTSCHRDQAECQSCQHTAFHIIKIIHKNNFCIHEKQNKISCCQTRIDPQCHSSETKLRKKDHTDQKDHQCNNKLDSCKAHQLF